MEDNYEEEAEEMRDKIDSLEQQNQTLTDMVEMQSNRIKELEGKDKLKNCEECYDKVSLVFKMRGIE